MRVLIVFAATLFAGSVIFSACSWTSGEQDTIVFPEKDVSFLLHVQPFLQQNCAYSPCHGVDFAGGISLMEYHHVIAVPNLVIAKNPEASRLVQILEYNSPHFANFYRNNITDNHIQGIRQWIKEGAINK